MKKTYRSLFCLLAVLLLSVSVLPSASALFSKKLYYYGVVEGVSRTVEGKVESILVTAEEQETYQMIVTDSTVWQDHDEKTTSDPATLAVGEQICVVHDPAVMMSLPPQSVAYTVIRNFPAGTDLEQEARDGHGADDDCYGNPLDNVDVHFTHNVKSPFTSAVRSAGQRGS